MTSGLWRDPNSRAITVNSSDQALFEWLLAFGGHALTHGEQPALHHLINVPDGVNLAVNTSITVYAVVFAPLTYLIGPPATFLVILTLNLAATALGLVPVALPLPGPQPARRRGRRAVHRASPPAMVSHANAHLNWTAGWLVPLLICGGCSRCAEPGTGCATAWCSACWSRSAFSIAAEGLFFTALALGVFVAVWALHPASRAEARAALPSMLRRAGGDRRGRRGAAGVPAVVALRRAADGSTAPASTRCIHSEDIAAYVAYPRRSLAGWAGCGTSLAPNPTEENSSSACRCCVLIVACFVVLWRRADPRRRATLRALGVIGVVFVVLSWGPRLQVDRRDAPTCRCRSSCSATCRCSNAALPARLALVVAPWSACCWRTPIDSLRAAPAGTARRRSPGRRLRGRAGAAAARCRC